MSRVPQGGNSALHSANCPRLNILLMKFWVLSQMQNVTEQISKSWGKLFLFATFASLLHKCPLSDGSIGGFQGSRKEFKWVWVGAKKFDPCSTSFLLELEGVWPKVKTIQLSPPRGGERSRSASPHNCGHRREGALATRGRVDLVGLVRGQVLEPSRHVGRTHPEVVEGGRGQPLPRDVLRKGFHHARLLGEQVQVIGLKLSLCGMCKVCVGKISSKCTIVATDLIERAPTCECILPSL